MADPQGQNSADSKEAPPKVIVIAVVSFFGLLAVGGASVIDGAFHSWIHDHHLGRLPVGLLWFAAVGGSLASLSGIFYHHKTDWKESYDLWHMLRPWTGLVMGLLGAFLLLVSTELATTTVSNTSHTAAPSGFNPDIYYAAAFITGFAEGPFRALVKRLTTAIFGPGDDEPRKSATVSVGDASDSPE